MIFWNSISVRILHQAHWQKVYSYAAGTIWPTADKLLPLEPSITAKKHVVTWKHDKQRYLHQIYNHLITWSGGECYNKFLCYILDAHHVTIEGWTRYLNNEKRLENIQNAMFEVDADNTGINIIFCLSHPSNLPLFFPSVDHNSYTWSHCCCIYHSCHNPIWDLRTFQI